MSNQNYTYIGPCFRSRRISTISAVENNRFSELKVENIDTYRYAFSMTLSALSAAAQVLREAGEPLHYEEITRRILDQGLWTTQGKTPSATISAQLAVDIKRKGASSRFHKVGRGVYALADATESTTKAPTTPQLPIKKGKTSKRNAGTLSFTDAAERILESSGGEPLHYREITRRALDQGMLNTSGLTPEATMYAQVLTEGKRKKRRGEQPRFLMLGRGMITLARWQAKGVAYQVEESNRKAKRELLARIKALSPDGFEELIGRLLGEIGFEEIEVTSLGNDGGIDVRGTLVVGEVIRTKLAVQVKRWKNNVQAPTVQQVRGSLGAHEQGLIITTSDFSTGARREAERPDATPVGLMDGEQLVALLVENHIGATLTELKLVELD